MRTRQNEASGWPVLAKTLLTDWPVHQWCAHHVLVAVSGGADSVALLLAMDQAARSAGLPPGAITVAHYNHQWRGEASAQDQLFVAKLALQLGRSCITNATWPLDSQADQIDSVAGRDLATLAMSGGVRLLLECPNDRGRRPSKSEDSARRQRYDFLIQAAYEVGAGYVATAHTADDRVETLLHNLVRGTGLAGAASLTQRRELDEQLVLVRPLLTRTRQQILQFLMQRDQAWCVDHSNEELAYGRNFIRHQVLPVMEQRFKQSRQSLLDFSELTEETMQDLEHLARLWLDRVTSDVARRRQLDQSRLRRWPESEFFVTTRAAARELVWSVLREALRQVWLARNWPQAEMSRQHWQRLRELLVSIPRPPMPSASATGNPLPETPKPPAVAQVLFHLPAGISVISDGEFIVIGRCSNPVGQPLS